MNNGESLTNTVSKLLQSIDLKAEVFNVVDPCARLGRPETDHFIKLDKFVF